MSLRAFRIREIEEKMRVASLALDFERAIPLRDEWRKLKAEAQEEAEAESRKIAERKVICISTRAAITPPEVAPENPEDGAVAEPKVGEPTRPVSEEDVSLLKHILEEVEGGRLAGLVILAGHVEPDDSIDVVSSWSTMDAWEHMQKFIGAMEETKHHFLAVDADLNEEVFDEE